MRKQQHPRLRLYVTVLVLLAELAHLAWEYSHGGIRSHHFLNSRDMPAISNWWGLLLLPALAWFLTGRTQRRIALQSTANVATPTLPASVIVAFVGALLFGVSLAVSFVNGYAAVTEYLFMGMLLLALILPVYRAECVLGFVLGMTFTFGAVLPALVGSVVAAVSAAAHLLVYPLVARLWAWSRRKWSPGI